MALILRNRFQLPHSITIMPDDVIIASIQEKKGAHECQVTVKRAIKVDTITFFDVDNDCGCVDGIGAIFGESK